jgi:hypothetical protein
VANLRSPAFEAASTREFGDEVAFAVRYRPSASKHCGDGCWFKPGQGCFNGIADTIKFNLKSLTVTLPNTIVYGIQINTTHLGPAPNRRGRAVLPELRRLPLRLAQRRARPGRAGRLEAASGHRLLGHLGRVVLLRWRSRGRLDVPAGLAHQRVLERDRPRGAVHRLEALAIQDDQGAGPRPAPISNLRGA